MEVYAYHLRTGKAGAERPPELHSKTLARKTNKNKTPKQTSKQTKVTEQTIGYRGTCLYPMV